MELLWLIVAPFAGGIAAWRLDHGGRRGGFAARWVSLAALAFDLAILAAIWASGHAAPVAGRPAGTGGVQYGAWFLQLNAGWIPEIGVSLHLAMDGLSFLLVFLTVFLGIVSVVASWTEIRDRVGFFHFNLLWCLTGVIGVFLALDLFLFYFFWEMMLVPMYFLIAVWGHERRRYAAIKFFIFTQLGGLVMLLAILGLYFMHGERTGVYTFDYFSLLGTPMSATAAFWLMLGFFTAFAVKLPAVPVHSWLPDAHTEAPTAGSVVLAGLLLKTGAYGLLRFLVPLFPAASAAFAPVAMALGVVGILYGALLAFGQTDLKKLIADTSISHMGFILIGVFAWNSLALQGVTLQIICHAISTGMLFILVGALQERIHTRDMELMGRLWEKVPVMGGVGMVFALASLGLPGLGNFVAEFLVLIGVFKVDPAVAVPAALGLIVSTVYALWMMQRVFHGEQRRVWSPPDLSVREKGIAAAMIILIVWLGLFPQPVINEAGPALHGLEAVAAPQIEKVSASVLKPMPAQPLSVIPAPDYGLRGQAPAAIHLKASLRAGGGQIGCPINTPGMTPLRNFGFFSELAGDKNERR